MTEQLKDFQRKYLADRRITRVRECAQYHLDFMVQALDEHATEAERNDNPQMADLYRMILDAVKKHGDFDNRGNLSITLELARDL